MEYGPRAELSASVLELPALPRASSLQTERTRRDAAGPPEKRLCGR
jgi:hypothetical protein